MDVSGSMGADQKELVRTESFWIDAWISSHYEGTRSVYIVHDAAAKEVDRETFFRIRESGGTVISSAYDLAARVIKERFSGRRLEPLPVPLHRWRKLQPPGQREVPRPAGAGAAALAEPVRLRPGGELRHQRRLPRGAEATLSHQRAGGAVPHSRSRLDRGLDQDPARAGEVDEADPPLPRAGRRAAAHRAHRRRVRAGLTSHWSSRWWTTRR